MKVHKILSLAALVCMLIFTSCKKEKSSLNETPNHLKVIPDSAMMVMSINARQLVDKGDLADYSKLNLYKYLQEELGKNEPRMFKLINEFLKNTRTSGLNLDQVYMCLFKAGEDITVPMFTAGVENADKFGNWLLELKKATDEDFNETILDKGSYKMLKMDYSTTFIWNKEVALMLGLSKYEIEELPELGELLKVDEGRSILTNADFKASYDKRKDCTIWLSTGKLFKTIGLLDKTIALNPILARDDFQKSSVDFSFNFTNEEAKIDATVYPESLMENYLKEFPIVKEDFEQSLLKYFPDLTYLAFKVSLNPSEYYRLMLDNMKTTISKMEEEYEAESEDYRYYPSTYYQFKEILTVLDNEKVASMVGNFKGDLLFSIYGFQEGVISIPYFSLAATIKGEKAFNDLMEILPKELNFEKTDSYYTCLVGGLMSMYVGQKDDILFVTNKKEAIDNFNAQGYKSSLANSAIGDELKKHSYYWYMNLNMEEYPAPLMMSLRSGMGEEAYGMLSDILKPYSYFNLLYSGKSSGELNVKTKKSNENTFKTLVNTVDNISSYYIKSSY